MKLKILFSLMLISIFFQNCTKDTCKETYNGVTYTPIYAPMSALRNVSVEAGKPIKTNGKIFIKGDYIFLNEVDKGFHIINNTNPANPVNIAFVKVPGNLDITGKGNFLFVDNYVDLLTFDITYPANIQLINRKESALPFRQYNYGFIDDSTRGIIIGFDKKLEQKTNDCGQSFWRNSGIGTRVDGIFFAQALSPAPKINIGGGAGDKGLTGSLSRFALLNNYLYIANRTSLTPIDISNPTLPIIKQAVYTGEQETIYPFKENLFIGTPSGLNIYGTSNPAVPNYISSYKHWRGCDPVVVENDIAYVTVRGGGPCGGTRNNLDVINVSNISQPILIKQYQMQNPYGLGVFNTKLGICDGDGGFKIYNASNSNNIQLISTINLNKAFDVIMDDQVAILIADDGLYQYNISGTTPQLISKIPIIK